MDFFKSLLIISSFFITFLSKDVCGAQRFASKINSRVFAGHPRSLTALPKIISSGAFSGPASGSPKLFPTIRAVQKNRLPLQSPSMMPANAHVEKNLIVQKQSSKRSDQKSSSKHAWYKRGYGSSLIGSGIALVMLTEPKKDGNSQSKTQLNKNEILTTNSPYKNECIAFAIANVATTEIGKIDSIIRIIELWPNDLLELKKQVLKLASRKIVHNNIIAALEKVHPKFKFLYDTDIYAIALKAEKKEQQKEQEKEQHEFEERKRAVDKVVVDNVVAPAYDSLLWGAASVAYTAIADSNGTAQAAKQIPARAAASVITTSVTNATVSGLGIKCPTYNKNDSNFGYYACNVCTKFVLPVGVSVAVNSVIFPSGK